MNSPSVSQAVKLKLFANQLAKFFDESTNLLCFYLIDLRRWKVCFREMVLAIQNTGST